MSLLTTISKAPFITQATRRYCRELSHRTRTERWNRHAYSQDIGGDRPNTAKKIDDLVSRDASGIPYYQIPHFGVAYQSKHSELKGRIQVDECRVFDNSDEVSKHLEETKLEALRQQEQMRRVVPPIDPSQQNPIERVLTYLFMGSPKPILETVATSDVDEAQLDLAAEELNEMKTAVVSAKGRRGSMEDAHIATQFEVTLGGERKSFVLTGVFDGHGGIECSQYAAENLENILKHYLEAFNKGAVTEMGISNALSLSLVDVSQAYNPLNLADSLYNPDSGCTANIALQIDGGDIWVANVGDSRAILVDGEGKPHQLSEDASPDEPRYSSRVIDRGGEIIPVHGKSRVNARLAVPTSLGDHWGDGIISSRPNLLKISPEDFNHFEGATLIQCCDGVYDVSTTEDVAARFEKAQKQGLSIIDSAEDIVKAAYACDSMDNLSVLIRQL